MSWLRCFSLKEYLKCLALVILVCLGLCLERVQMLPFTYILGPMRALGNIYYAVECRTEESQRNAYFA